MKIPAGLDELLQKPMDRKEFLQHTAAITLFVAGGGMIAQSLLKGLKFGQGSQPAAAAGYGASSYGGVSATSSRK